jgi:hypothetical protein
MRRTPSGDTYRIATAHAAQQIKSPSREYFRLPPSPLGAPGSLLRSERLARLLVHVADHVVRVIRFDAWETCWRAES